MVAEMNGKKIELKRITKTAALLIMSGMSPNSIPQPVVTRCLEEQHDDGGWAGVADTFWNVVFLQQIEANRYSEAIEKGLRYLQAHKTPEGLWGRSRRDISRIPVAGALLYLLPELATPDTLASLERLWISEKNSLTYKAAYTLMAFRRNAYEPWTEGLIDETVRWLADNQRDDGGFAPWKSHPVDTDVFCTSIALLGLLQYPKKVEPAVFEKGFHWLVSRQLPSGIWRFHEIEDGASWGLYAMTQLLKLGVTKNAPRKGEPVQKGVTYAGDMADG